MVVTLETFWVFMYVMSYTLHSPTSKTSMASSYQRNKVDALFKFLGVLALTILLVFSLTAPATLQIKSALSVAQNTFPLPPLCHSVSHTP